MLLLLSIAAFKHEIFNINHHDGSNPLESIIFLAAIIVTFVVFEKFIDSKIDKLYIFRWQMMGCDNIEGVWLDIVRNNGSIKCGSLLSIQYIDDEYKISGDEYFENGMAGGSFSTESSSYKNRKLEFTHCSRHEDGETINYGRGHYDFIGFKCMQFTGCFTHDHDDRHFEVRGVRLSSVLHEIPQENLAGVSTRVLHYYRKGIRRKLSRLLSPRPNITPTEKNILTVAIIKYYRKFLQCGSDSSQQADEQAFADK